MFALAFPAIDPTLVEIGPFAIRWYALAYIAGILLGWRYALLLSESSSAPIGRYMLDDFMLWATLGIVIGGRLGYVLFYKIGYFVYHPVEVVYVWQGGMSFHGGMLGVMLAMLLFSCQRKIPMLALGDILASVAPIGLFFGRLANFINGELYGRPSDMPWAMLFPRDPETPRHPSQLYEAALEGILLFAVLWFIWNRTSLKKRPGAVIGVFLIGYGVSRILVEFFREPDAHLGFIVAGISMGQILSLPMILAGLFLIYWAKPLSPVRQAKPVAQKKSKA